MIYFSNIEELNKLIREQLIVQSQLDSNFVLNSLSIHGEDLDKLLEEQIYESIERSDVMLLFELRSRDSESDMSQTELDDSITNIRSFSLYVILYGNDSSNLSNNLFARFTSEEVKLALQDSGIYIQNVTKPTTINEYKNNTMWIRNDLSIDITCAFKIDKITTSQYFEDASTIQIIRR